MYVVIGSEHINRYIAAYRLDCAPTRSFALLAIFEEE